MTHIEKAKEEAEKVANKARAEIAELERKAEEAREAAVNARAAFRRDPSEKTHSCAAVADQKAANAVEALAEARSLAAPIFGAEQRAQSMAYLEELERKGATWELSDAAWKSHIANIVNLSVALQNAIDSSLSYLDEQRKLAKEAQHIATKLGLERQYTALQSGDVLMGEVHKELRARYRGDSSFPWPHAAKAWLNF